MAFQVIIRHVEEAEKERFTEMASRSLGLDPETMRGDVAHALGRLALDLGRYYDLDEVVFSGLTFTGKKYGETSDPQLC